MPQLRVCWQTAYWSLIPIMVANVETSEQIIGGKEKEELNRARGIGERVRKEIGLVQILYVLSVTCRSLLIIERQEVRMCMCVGNKSREPNCSDAFIYQLTTKRKKIKLLFLHWFWRSLGSLLLLNSCTSNDAAQVFSSKISRRTFRSTVHTHI